MRYLLGAGIGTETQWGHRFENYEREALLLETDAIIDVRVELVEFDKFES